MEKFKIFFCLFVSFTLTEVQADDGNEPIKPLPTSSFILYGLISLALVLFGGLMSGLTVGLLGLDELDLELKLSNGSLQEKDDAKKILSIIDKHHLLLVTLLLCNSAAMETLPLFLDKMFNTEISLLISVTFVLAFGEVIPQALCTGKDQMKIALKMVPVVKFLMIVMFPLSFPLAKFLDWLMKHKESSVKMNKEDLKTFISMHNQKDEGLDRFQVSIMHGVIDFNCLKVKRVMEPYSDFVRVDIEKPIKREVTDIIIGMNYHSFVVFRKHKSEVVGVVKVSELFRIWEGDFLDPNCLNIQKPVIVSPKFTLLLTMKQIEASKSTLAFVVSEVEGKKKVVGIVTREGVLRKMLKEEEFTEREEITKISRALARSIDKPNVHKKPVTPLRENLIR